MDPQVNQKLDIIGQCSASSHIPGIRVKDIGKQTFVTDDGVGVDQYCEWLLISKESPYFPSTDIPCGVIHKSPRVQVLPKIHAFFFFEKVTQTASPFIPIKAGCFRTITIMSSIQSIQKKISTLTTTPPKFKVKKGVLNKFSNTIVKVDGKPLKVKMTGDLFMVPTKTVHDDYGTKYSVGVEFSESDCAIFENILDSMDPEDGWVRKETHDDGKIFLKLRTNASQSEFLTTSNIAIRPSKLHSDKLDLGMEVQVEMDVGGWFMQDEDEKIFGVTLKVKSIHYGSIVQKKRRKTDDDEVRTLFNPSNVGSNASSYIYTYHTLID